MDKWPRHKAYIWEHAPFFRLLVPLVAGIVGYDVCGRWAVAYWAAMIAVSFILMVPVALRRTGSKQAWLFVLLHCLLLSGGYMIAGLNDVRNNPAWYGRHTDNTTTCIAVVTATPVEREHTWKLPVQVAGTIKDGHVTATCGNGIVYLYKDEQPMLYHMGDTLLIPAAWQPVQNAGNPYEFDHASYLRRNNIVYQQFCAGKAVRLYAQHQAADETVTEHIHMWCMVQLEEYITDSKTKGLIQAMLIGDEVNLDEDMRQSFTDTGIVHVIAISGGNVMMFFLVIGWALAWIKNRKYIWINYAIALPLIWFYVLMAGASPSAIRAAIMFSLLAGGILLSKNQNSLNQLLATAFVLLCAQPMWLYSLGFQLSFVAVLSLIIFYGPIYSLYTPVSKYKAVTWCMKKVWETLCASLAAEILVAPLVVYYFHNFPVMFLVANVLAYVFMFVVLVLGIAIIVFSGLHVVAGAIGLVTTWVVWCFNKLLAGLQWFNPVSFHFLRLTVPGMLLLYIAIAGVALLLLREKKAGLLAALGSLCLFMLLLCAGKYTSLLQQRFVVYNTGKNNHIELIDGSYYCVLSADTTAPDKIRYATNPSHIEWQAWQAANRHDSVLYIHGQRILILNEEGLAGSFPVDYLVVNYHGATDPQLLQKVYTPKCIVIGNNYTRKEQETWIAAAVAAHIKVHAVAIDGAFVME